jgi:ribosomal subunit interface protein
VTDARQHATERADAESTATPIDIVVRARHLELSTRFRELVAEKLAKVERFDGKCHRIDVEVSAESNPRQAASAVRLELTCHGKGPVVRAEAAASDKYAALDAAYAKLEQRLRRAADRRSTRNRGRGARPPVAGHAGDGVVGAAVVPPALGSPAASDPTATAAAAAPIPAEVVLVDGLAFDADGPMVVREKTHHATPMTLDQALERMELVGHDFFLFHDATSGLPSVVYRRRGYDYGVLHLAASPEAGPAFVD